jgi:hypothetical protein
MKRKVLLLLLALLSLPFSSLADTFKNGVLQAYWLPNWNADINSPELKLRFFVFSKDGKQQEVVNIENSPLDENFIKNEFATSSGDFFKFKEGHIEQAGKVKLTNFSHHTECDAKTFQAKLIKFKAAKENFEIDESNGACERSPYLITYQLKDGVSKVEVFNNPNNSAEQVGVIDNQHTLVKVRSVNSEWFYMAKYDESKKDLMGLPKGYVRVRDITPVN